MHFFHRILAHAIVNIFWYFLWLQNDLWNGAKFSPRSQLTLEGTSSWQVAVLLVHVARWTRVRSSQRTQSSTAPTAWDAYRLKGHRCVSTFNQFHLVYRIMQYCVRKLGRKESYATSFDLLKHILTHKTKKHMELWTVKNLSESCKGCWRWEHFSFQPQTLQWDFLMKILPNYHHMKKTVKGSSTPVRNWWSITHHYSRTNSLRTASFGLASRYIFSLCCKK